MKIYNTDEEDEETVSTEELQEAAQALLGLQPADAESWGPNSIVYFGSKTRSVLINGEINDKLSAAICSQVHELATQSQTEPITVHINTPGGSILDALAIYDTLQCVPCPVITLVSGGAFSAGVLLAMAGDIRLVTPNSMYWYHQPMMQTHVDSPSQMDSSYFFYQWSHDRFSDIIRTRAGLSEKKWAKKFAHTTSYYFSAPEALKLGIATAMLDYYDKPQIALTMQGDEE